MANTYTLISSNVLASSAASVTFSAIPSTYTDLVLRFSARGTGTTTSTVYVRFNGTTANYSYTQLIGTGSAASSSRASATTFITSLENRGSYTANTFSSNEIYIPSYTAAQNKPVSLFNVQEDNATAAIMSNVAGLWSNTAAITEVSLAPDVDSFATGSSFYLYGISKN